MAARCPLCSPPDEELDTPEALVHSMTVYAIVGIKDPVRKEVPHAVATCQKAGVVVRMVTGDNIHTARHISKECGLFDESQVCGVRTWWAAPVS